MGVGAGGVDAIPNRQLIGSSESDEDAESNYDPAPEEAALERLVLDQRGLVRDALVERFGGVPALFASLWQTSRVLEDDEEPETDDEILNVVTFDRMAAFGWLENGCDTVNYDNSELD